MIETLSDNVQLTKRGTVRKRKPKQSLEYFTKDTEDAILEYLITENSVIRNKIYNERINYAFYKLAENIIHTFKFYYMDVEDIEDLKHEIITFLLEKLHLYHQGKKIDEKFYNIITEQFQGVYDKKSFRTFTNNSNKIENEQIIQFVQGLEVSNECKQILLDVKPPKAYSYFGTIVKRYLINYNAKNYKKIQEHTPELEADKDYYIINDLTLEFEKQDHDISKFMLCFNEYMDKNIYKIFQKEREIKIAGALLMIFKNVDNLELFNKKAIFLYIKEMTEVTTARHITKVIDKFEKVYIKLYQEYEQKGYITL
jgi:hypothetical protein